MKVFALGLASPAVLFGLILGVTVIGSSGTPASAAATVVCVSTGPVMGLDNIAATNARIVTATAERKVGSAGAVIAVMVGLTESGLRALGNPTVVGGGAPQGTGSNYDSIGIFQQRASWGTVAQRLDAQVSTGLFVARLSALPGWRQQVPWAAAQSVQRSAYDGRPRAANNYNPWLGGNYQVNLAKATSVVAAIDVDAARASCGGLAGGVPASTAPGSRGLPSSYAVPSSATPAERKVITYALAQLDKPYAFGADGPTAFDCSGLVLAAWAQAGIALPHQAASQATTGTPTTARQLVPGDLVFVPGDDGSLAAPGHVGIYLGHGLVVNAADERDGIRVQTYDNFLQVGHGLAGLRHLL